METKEKLTLTKAEARKILHKLNKDYEIISNQVTENSRWSIYHYLVIKRLSDGNFFADVYGVGATECQDEQPWAYDEPNFTEVFPVEKTIIVYE